MFGISVGDQEVTSYDFVCGAEVQSSLSNSAKFTGK
jgi:hypothetical protein